jgi:hypothetical protein
MKAAREKIRDQQRIALMAQAPLEDDSSINSEGKIIEYFLDYIYGDRNISINDAAFHFLGRLFPYYYCDFCYFIFSLFLYFNAVFFSFNFYIVHIILPTSRLN